jgi:feruloyl esterase
MFILLLIVVFATAAASRIVGSPHAANTDVLQTREATDFQSACEEFGSKLKLENARLNSVTYIPIGGSVTITELPESCALEGLGLNSSSSFAFCRVTLNVTTSSQSQVFMEAWLPSNYSGRFLSTGNGGLGGCKHMTEQSEIPSAQNDKWRANSSRLGLIYPDMQYAAHYGFATVGTNNGHFGDTGQFFYHNAEVLEDFAYRALHTGVVVGKEIVQQFYSQGIERSYYLGSSTGGRQGWMSVQRFPDDFDGVVAGCPAFNFINLINWGARFYPTTGTPDADTFVSSAKWEIIHDEIMRQCDALDGAADGIIENPDLCQPIFETLLCSFSAPENTTCLTAAQATAVNTIFSPLSGINGSSLFPRMQPGSELAAATGYYAGVPFPYAQDWYRYVVYGDPSWDPGTWTIFDTAKANDQDPYGISTWDGDISAFNIIKTKLLLKNNNKMLKLVSFKLKKE